MIWLELSEDRIDQSTGQQQDEAEPLDSSCSSPPSSSIKLGMWMIHPTPWLLIFLISFPKVFPVSFSYLLPLVYSGHCLHLNCSISEITMSNHLSSEIDPSRWTITSHSPFLELQMDLQFSYPLFDSLHLLTFSSLSSLEFTALNSLQISHHCQYSKSFLFYLLLHLSCIPYMNSAGHLFSC